MWLEAKNISSIEARNRGIATEWELYRILKNKNALENTTFYFGDKVVSGRDIEAVYSLLEQIQRVF